MRKGIESFDEFKAIIMHEIKEVFGKDIIEKEIIQRNGIKLSGVLKVTNRNLAPIIYLDRYYKSYKEQHCSIDDIISDIIKNLEAKPDEKSLAVISELDDFSKVRNRLTFKLINYEKNKDYLANTVYTRFWDLAIVYFMTVDITETSMAEVIVRQELLDIWKITEEELNLITKENMQRLFKPKIETIEFVISKLLEVPLEELQGDISQKMQMWVLYIEDNPFGAASILYDGVLKEFANTVNSDIIILPSAIHEVILVLDNDLEYRELKNIVKDINSTVLSEDEILSDNIYKYIRALDKIVMLDSNDD